ncbi:MAG: DNRLRE domain-containing protein [Clostridiales bacterium]|nr:DNRLRE domain-containing protein [Clostridiales bacterium]
MKKNIRICGIVGFLIFLLCNVSFASLNVPLTVSDYAGMARANDPVTSGIPLPESANITSIDQLQVTDSLGNNVPAQFTVTSRWRGTPDDNSKPIKWVLLDFQADIPDDGTSVYYLKNGNIGNAQNTELSLQQNNDKITVNTGKAKFEINKNYFNLFDYVHVDKDNDGQLNDLVVSSANDGGVVLTGKDGTKYYTILEAPEEIEIEEQGPMRTVVKIRGVFKAEDGSYFAPSITDPANATKENFDKLGYAYNSGITEGRFSQPYEKSFVYYNCRIHFYNDKDYVRILLTLENNGANGRTEPETTFAPIQVVFFDSVNLIIKPNNTNQINITSEDSSTQLDFSDNFTLYQNWKENLTDEHKDTLEINFEKGIYYTTKKNSQELSNGSTNPGWVDANNNAQGIGLAIRHFWQNFPKKITVDNSEIKIGFWPEEGYYPYCQQSDFPEPMHDIYCKKGGRDGGVYLFDAGRHKTYEMFLRFYPGSQDSQTKNLSKSLENPLMALAPSEWYAETKALGMIAPDGLTSTDPEINEAMERFEKFQTSLVYEEDSENGYTINNIKTTTTSYHFAKHNHFFNWMNFGDLTWIGGMASSLHYDWTYSILLHYIRTGKRNFFDAGVEMAKHRYDIDQYHGERTATSGHHTYCNNMAFYESEGHADPNLRSDRPSKVSLPSHTWNGGSVLYYLLTGDKKSLEVAEEVGKGAVTRYGDSINTISCASAELRMHTWPILNHINLYRVTGKEQYIDFAKKMAKNKMLYAEQQQGGQGYWGIKKGYVGSTIVGGCPDLCINYQWSTMYIYTIDALINIHYETQDEELKQLVIRMADFSKDMFLYGGDYNEEGMYMPLQTQSTWDKNNPGGGEPVKSIWFGDLFAYAYSLTGDSEYLDWTRKCFRDGMFYYTARGTTYIDPEYRSKASFIDSMFNNTATKVHGWIGRTNQVYLYTEWQLQKGDLQIIDTSLPNGTVSQNYSYPVSIAGGTSPYTWTYSDIASWLTVNAINETMREISGIPPQTGSFSFTIQIEDSTGIIVTKQFTLEVKEQTDSDSIAITTQSLPEAIVGSEYIASLNASGGSHPYVWFIINSSDLPAGIYIEGNTLSGIPEEVGLYEFIVTANDGSQEATKNLCIKVTISDIDIPDTDIPDIEVYETNCDFGSVNTGDSAELDDTDVNDTDTLRNNISDTTLDGYSELRKDKNLGGMSELHIWSNGVRKILLRPYFSQNLADAVIEKAELKLYCYSLGWPSQNPKLEVYRMTHDWAEGEGIWYKDTDGGATWHEYDRNPVEINEWNMPGSDIDTITDFGYGANGIVSEAVMQKDSWVTFDITELAKKWFSNEMDNYGILIQAIDRGYNEARFYSSEYEDESLRPMLVVSYSDGSTEALNIHSELSQGIQNADYEASISASGGNLPYQWSIQNLPAGLDRRYLDDTAITIYGISTESGQFSLEVTVEDNNAQTLTTYLALTIVEPEPDSESDSDLDLDTITLRDNISDTTLDGYSEVRKDKNLGGMGELNIWSNGVQKILLRPDFSQSFANTAIEKAELKLYCYSLNWPSQNPKLEAYRMTHDWEEGEGIWYKATNGGATWHEYDRNPVEINEWSTPGGDIDTMTDFGYGPNGIVSEAVMQKDSWITFDITELAQEWISNEMENYGILIQAIDRGCNEARFYSSEYEDENLRPKFVIEYVHY